MEPLPKKEPGKLQMSKVSAIAFIIVLVFIAIAGYLVYVNIRANWQTPAVIAPKEETPSATIVVEKIIDTPTPAVTPAPTETATPIPSATSTTILVAPSATATSAGPTISVVTPTTTPTFTPKPGTGTKTPTPADDTSPPSGPTPTATRLGRYTFYLDGDVVHDVETSCVAQYIRGVVRDKAGDPLEGVRIKAYDLWGNEALTVSKGGPDIGKWDIVLGGTPNVWKVVVLDPTGQEISPIAVVPHHQEDEFKDACVHIVNWRRAW